MIMSDTKLDVNKIYENANKELGELNRESAVLDNKIKESAKALGVEPTIEAVESKITELTSKKEKLTKSLEKFVAELEETENEEVEEEATQDLPTSSDNDEFE